ncbi:MAG TPA: hypothetical protein VFF00_09320 [Candidatus Elarobacter sp.]|nr:hypothetical protein [Candidatus Elarobacter sp.]
MIAAVLALSLSAPALGQNAPPAGPPCAARQANLGGIGRASVVAFTGPVFGAPVCATVANLSIDAFAARIAGAPSSDALVAAALTNGGSITLPLEGATMSDLGPYVVAPGGVIPSFGGDTSEAPRVVLAYAGQRVLVIGTSPVALVDLARVLRVQSSLFGTDAVERAIVLASGPDAAIMLNTADGVFGATSIATPRMLLLIKRG